jgi:hypothetical protein
MYRLKRLVRFIRSVFRWVDIHGVFCAALLVVLIILSFLVQNGIPNLWGLVSIVTMIWGILILVSLAFEQFVPYED